MDSKKIVVFFGKKIGKSDPFKQWGKKSAVYHSLFTKGVERGFEMYFVPKKEYHLGNLRFNIPWKYSAKTNLFHPTHGIITADAIYDRSGGLSFPDKGIDAKVLNCWDFKALCADKNATYDLLGKFMPLSFPIQSQEELHACLSNFSPDERVVLKPAEGFGGKGIVIDYPEKIQDLTIVPDIRYTLQKFIDTSRGIPGITESYHDLRIIIVNGKVVLSHVRTPRPGSLMANIAQGGTLEEVPLEAIPSFILQAVKKIQEIVDKKFDYPLYSVDLGVAGEDVYVFELNDQIGFPIDTMKNSEKFIDELLESLSQRAVA